MTTTISITATPPTLPTELIEDILAQDSLKTADFARCCLVSRQFLSPARRSLYSAVEIGCCPKDPSQSQRHHLTASSVRLIETLRSSSTLGSLVQAVYCCRTYKSVRGRDFGKGATEMLEELLETLPQVNQLFLRHYAFDPTWNYILSRPSKWTILDLQGIHIYEDSVFLENTPFTNLEKLRCGFDNGGTLYLPPRLTNLDFCYFDRQPASILNVITSRIRFLRILTRHFVQSTDFARLPHLQHLELLEFGDEDDKDRKLGGLLESCRHLSSLTLNSDDWFLTADLSYLLQRLPASLLRIDFAYYTSLKSLNDLLEKGPLKSIRILGVSEGYEEAEELNDLRTLKRLCGKRRIKVKEITHAPSPFDF